MSEADMAALVREVNSNNEPAVRVPLPTLCDEATDPLDEGLPPKGWPAIRQVVLHRDQYRCYLCGDEATEVDHLWPRARGGSDRLSNLRGVCRRCNATKGDALLIKHITPDRASDAEDHYVDIAIRAITEAARWCAVQESFHLSDPTPTVPEMQAALRVAADDPSAVRWVARVVVSLAGAGDVLSEHRDLDHLSGGAS